MAGWRFWVDRGGTFTDVIALQPNGQYKTHKLLSVNPRQYENSAIQGIRDLLGLSYEQAIPVHLIEEVKVGTTVATNALLERKGEKVALVITKGFKDALTIAMQNRPDIFALDIRKPEQLYQDAIEIEERISATGEIITPINIPQTRQLFSQLKQQGYQAIAIVLMHAWCNPQHEQALQILAKEIGFSQISISHQVSNTIKLIPRGDTTVVDAYLTPVMQRYVQQISDNLPKVPLFFMQSNGGLAQAHQFQGKDAILSGPAGGIVGAVKTSAELGFNQIIGFDMGGTSTDVSHCANQEYERCYQTEVAGVRLAAPMMNIHTVAAGGGSVCQYLDGRFQVGPESAGSFPGPACYRNKGPMTVTDCNLLLGKIKPEWFPAVFGDNADQTLDKSAAIQQVEVIQQALMEEGIEKTIEQIAEGFLAIAVDNMANAVKKISTQRGYHLKDYALVSFGGAGGQHACLIADNLQMNTILIHPYAGVLSAYGIGLAEQLLIKSKSIQAKLSQQSFTELETDIALLTQQARQALQDQGAESANIVTQVNAQVKYSGAEVTIEVPCEDVSQIERDFHQAHLRQFSYNQPQQALMIDAINVVASVKQAGQVAPVRVEAIPSSTDNNVNLVKQSDFYSAGQVQDAKCYQRSSLILGQKVLGPAIIVEKTGTNIIEMGWQAEVIEQGVLKLTKLAQLEMVKPLAVDPISLEVFNNLFMVIAEQMGVTLQNTAHSVNIRERLDFSCALFDEKGDLVANAPHVPVHLGSMSHSVKSIIEQRKNQFTVGDGFLINSPYHGGTHLPDLTLVTPVFVEDNVLQPSFFVASRAHHADVGGIRPGSMPADSTIIEQEGLLFSGEKIIKQGQLDVKLFTELFSQGEFPARNIPQNLADMTAQLAANQHGQQALIELTKKYGSRLILTFMTAIQDNAERAVRNAIAKLDDCQYELEMDSGAKIKLDIKLDPINQSAVIDFSGTSAQQNSNFNAPRSVTDAAVIYVFRSLVDKAIPLNAGCMRPLTVVVEEGSMLSPIAPAAVVAGNVEVSQALVSCLLLALGKTAASQTTMNNLTFGDEQYQYYETLAGGTGAGIDNNGNGFTGCDAVHSHMTNSRLTDPEILEQRFPVVLTEFSIRQGSAGQGLYNGGNGIIRSMLFKQAMSASVLSNCRVVAPKGLNGGGDGQCGYGKILRKSGQIEKLAYNSAFELNVGDMLTIATPGGGAYGESLDEKV